MRKALVVGINKYPKTQLNGCVNDAKAVAQILERNSDETLNFHIKTDFDVDTKAKLRSSIRECFSGDEDVTLFYYSGHGFIDAIGGYIVTPDFCRDDMGVSMQEILEIVNLSKCRNKVVILDCCHAGFMGDMPTVGQGTAVIKEGVTILTSSKTNESSMEVNGHGVFTSLLLDALKGGAADITGHITPGGVYAFIDKALGPWEQRPVFKTNVTRFTPLRTVKPQVDSAILRRIVDYFPEPEQECPLDPSFEPTNAVDVEHKIIEPYAVKDNIAIFKDLQKMESVGLVVPCNEDHMYFAAMHSKSCRLTSTGQHYWRLVKNNKL